MIRKINIEDIDNINNIMLKYDVCFEKHYDLEKRRGGAFEDYIYDDGQIKGLILTSKIDNESQIELVYVVENFRNNGIATKLIEYLEKNSSEIILEVSKENKNALSLYKKLNFKEIGIRKGYYNGIDALVLKKVIK